MRAGTWRRLVVPAFPTLLSAALPHGLPMGEAAGQAPPDSIAAWVTEVRTGSLPEKVVAVGRLHATGPSNLPDYATDAVVMELAAVNNALLDGIPVPGIDELRGEDFGEYYLDLVSIAGASDSPEARRSMILSSATSLGASRRAARLGDQAIPTLVEMIERGYQASDALDVLALAWFWADSTGAPLSPRSRAAIFEQLSSAAGSNETDLLLGAATALTLIKDPTFLPFARRMAERRSEPGIPSTVPFNFLELDALPVLEERAETIDIETHLALAAKNLQVACVDAAQGPRSGLCSSLENQFETARRHLEAGRTGPAGNVLGAIAGRLDRELASGTLAEAEHALLAGGTRQVMGRLP